MSTFANRNEFKNYLLSNASKLIILKAYADWCAPCKRVAPEINGHIASLIQEHGLDNVIFIQINIDDDSDIATYLKITKLPTLISYIGGEITHINISSSEKDIVDFFYKSNCSYSLKYSNPDNITF